MTGEKTRMPRRTARYGQGVLSQRRSRGEATRYRRIEAARKQAVYLERSAAPQAAPAASHHPLRGDSSAFPKNSIESDQKRSRGASGNPNADPTNAAGVTAKRSTVHRAASFP